QTSSHNSSSHLRSLTLSHIVSQSQIEIGKCLNIRIFSSRSAEAALSQPDSANTQLTIATPKNLFESDHDMYPRPPEHSRCLPRRDKIL
ncbi:hypothetical protein FOC4_g10006051, partial [Fusarium odoratissimum]